MEVGGSYNLTESFKRGIDVRKRSFDSQFWLQATCVSCSGGGRRPEIIQVTITRSIPSVGHGISTIDAMFQQGEGGVYNQTVDCRACCQTPNGESFSDNYAFLSPAAVLGQDNPLSLITERVSLLGDLAHTSACGLQRRIDWLEAAQATGTPLHTILYSNEAADQVVVFNLFSPRDANRLKFADRLVAMTGKYRPIYEVLQAIQYELPQDAEGTPFPPEQLLMEILDERRNDRGDDEESPSPSPATEGQRSRRRSRGPVGSGRR
jgi:hypothetical protein